MPFFVIGRVTLCMFRRTLGSHRFVMHFVGDSVGFRGRILMIRFVVFFVIVFLINVVIVFVITFVIGVLIGVQRFLQLFDLGGLDIRFRHGFDRLGAFLGLSLRLFVLGFRELLGEGGYIFLGKARAIRALRVARGFRFGSGRRNSVLLRGGVRRDLRFPAGGFRLRSFAMF
jgi:hypothetical protein